MRRRLDALLLVAGAAAGLALAYVDTRPTWDDTAVTAGALLVTAGVVGAARGRQPWLSAAAVGLWIPLLNIVLHGNAGGIAAVPFALAGAYAGSALRRPAPEEAATHGH